MSVCLLNHAKTSEPIEMPFGGLTRVGQRNHVEWGQGRTNSFAAAKGDKAAMRPFVKILCCRRSKLIGTLSYETRNI